MVRWLRLPTWLPCALLAWLPGVLFAATPSRVVSVVPHLTELLYDIGAGDKLVAVDDASDYPAEVKTKPKVANYRSINVEALLAQKPDLILGWRSAQSRMLAPLEQLGIPVFYSEPTDFASLATEMRALGKLLGVLRKVPTKPLIAIWRVCIPCNSAMANQPASRCSTNSGTHRSPASVAMPGPLRPSNSAAGSTSWRMPRPLTLKWTWNR